MHRRQKKHVRRSKLGKPFVAGRRKSNTVITPKVKNQVLRSNADDIVRELRTRRRAKIPNLGVLRLKIKPATKGGKKITAFGRTFTSKAKPRRAVIKFSATKGLKEKVA